MNSASSLRLASVCGASLIVLAYAGSAWAQQRMFAVPAGPAVKAIPTFAKQAGLQIVAPAESLAEIRTSAIEGRMDARIALGKLLKGARLEIASDEGSVVILRPTRTTRPTLEPVALKAAVAAQAAAPAAAPTQSEPETIDEILVTALKRGTTIQTTPISISAISGETLANAGVQSIADLGKSTPGLTFVDAGPSNRRVVIRGIQTAGEATVGVYYDEAPVSGAVGSGNDAGRNTPELRLFDVDRVEVLRGPQGTLYGAGSMGGTLRIIYKKPEQDYAGAIDASLADISGGGLAHEINGMINLPLVADKLAARAVVFSREDDGYVDSLTLRTKDINYSKSSGGRLMLRATPSPSFTIDAAAFYQTTDAHYGTWDLAAGPYNSTARSRLPIEDELQLYSITANWDVGFADLIGTATHFRRELNGTLDTSDFVPLLASAAACQRIIGGGAACTTAQLQAFQADAAATTAAIWQQQDVTNDTAEVRLVSKDDKPLKWAVGAYLSDRDTYVDNPFQRVDAATGARIEPPQYLTRRFIWDRLKQKAVFGEISYDATDKLNLTVGLRYFDYDKTISGQTTVPNALIGAAIVPLTTVTAPETGWVSKFNASYKFTPNHMLYLEAAQGFRPGGVNQVIGLAAALTPYASDSLWNYEAGFKTSWFDRRLHLNIDVYQIDWKDMQVNGNSVNGGYSFTSNAGAARVRGVELEVTATPLRGLDISAAASASDAHLTENQANSNITAPGRDGDRIPYVPTYTANVSAQYRWPMTDRFSALARVDANAVGPAASELRRTSTTYRRLDAYHLVNTRFGVEAPDGAWGVYAFVTNLLDDLAISTKSPSALSGFKTLVTSAPPRTVGVNLRTRF
jgi:iron complex outermembrane recepter protein